MYKTRMASFWRKIIALSLRMHSPKFSLQCQAALSSIILEASLYIRGGKAKDLLSKRIHYTTVYMQTVSLGYLGTD